MVTYGYIPRRLSPLLLHSDGMSDENGGGDRGNINEEGVPFQEILYAVEDL